VDIYENRHNVLVTHQNLSKYDVQIYRFENTQFNFRHFRRDDFELIRQYVERNWFTKWLDNPTAFLKISLINILSLFYLC